MAADQCGQERNGELISFPEWAGVLARDGEIPAARREAYRGAIIAFLGFCKRRHAGASVILIKAYLAQVPEQARSGAQEALRWWYRAAQGGGSACGLPSRVPAGEAGNGSKALAAFATAETEAAESLLQDNPAESGSPLSRRAPRDGDGRTEGLGGVRHEEADGAENRSYRQHRQAGVPPPRAADDLGGPDWERDLIKACRERGFLWRTEETYRGWAGRFATFLRPRSPYVAGREEVGAFLSHLAVTQRASGSTQKQALNALVFLMQEALHRDLGELDFHRAERKVRVPTVLSVAECERLFAQLDGTPQLMAKLAYGAGLRLMELIRLRVHHLDLDRRQLRVLGGKGRVKGFAPRGFCTA